MSTREILIAILIISLGVTGTAWFLANFEQVTKEEWTGFRGEARRNPWLAAQRLLEHINLPASELRDAGELRNLQPGAVLVLPMRRSSVPEPLLESIVDWVRNGGFLVVEPENLAVSDSLLAAFGVVRVETTLEDEEAYEDEELDHDDLEAEKIEAEPMHCEGDVEYYLPVPTVIRLPDSSVTSMVEISERFSLSSDSVWFQAGTEKTVNILGLHEGDGTVVVVNDLDFGNNRKIGDVYLDHAQFIVELARLAQRSGPVVFFNNPGQPSLMKWLRTNAWAPMTAAALALFLWLWKVVPRFGPVAPDPERARRRLLDHLRASGRFLWARGKGARLLEVSREACLRRISRALPDFETATASMQAAQLIRMFGISGAQVQQILSPQTPGKMLHFMHTIHLYQTIHSRLAMQQAKNNRRTK